MQNKNKTYLILGGVAVLTIAVACFFAMQKRFSVNVELPSGEAKSSSKTSKKAYDPSGDVSKIFTGSGCYLTQKTSQDSNLFKKIRFLIGM